MHHNVVMYTEEEREREREQTRDSLTIYNIILYNRYDDNKNRYDGKGNHIK